jgi:hypothetical protein
MGKPNYSEINRWESSLWHCLTRSGYEPYTQSNKESHDKGTSMSLERSRRLEILNIALAIWGAIAGTSFIWPHRTCWIWALVVLAGSLLWAWMGLGKFTLICYGILFVAAFTTIEMLPPMPQSPLEMESYLTPGNEASPPTRCPVGDSSFVLYVGDNVTALAAATEFNILSVNDMSLLRIERGEKGITISAKIFNQNGIVVEIEKNKIIRSASNSFKMIPTDHAVSVIDNYEKPVLSVDYMNPRALKIAGIFYYPGNIAAGPAFVFNEDPARETVCFQGGSNGNCGIDNVVMFNCHIHG